MMLNIISFLCCCIYTYIYVKYFIVNYLLIVQTKNYIAAIDKVSPRDGLPWWLELTCQWRRHRFNPWVRENPLKKEMANHSSILTWRIPWTDEPGQPHRVTKSQTWLSVYTHTLPGINTTYYFIPIKQYAIILKGKLLSTFMNKYNPIWCIKLS